MTNAQHTPGPWNYNEGYKSQGYAIHAPNLGMDSNIGRTFAPHSISEDEHKANGRLIAAAPELLDSLVVWRDMYEQLPHEMKKAMNLAFNHGNKAIAKAKGE